MIFSKINEKHRFLLIIDEIGQDVVAKKVMQQFYLKGNVVDHSIKLLQIPSTNGEKVLDQLHESCVEKDEKSWNIILPLLNDLLCCDTPGNIFRFFQKFTNAKYVKHVMLWISLPSLMHYNANFLVDSCKYMADAILVFNKNTNASITIHQPFGKIFAQQFKCIRTKESIEFQTIKQITTENGSIDNNSDHVGIGTGAGGDGVSENGTTSTDSEPTTTFKINLEEDETVARNSLILPYEKVNENQTGNIHYTLDDYDMDDSENED